MLGYLQELIRDGKNFTVVVTDVRGTSHSGSVRFDGIDSQGLVIAGAGNSITCLPWTGVASIAVTLL